MHFVSTQLKGQHTSRSATGKSFRSWQQASFEYSVVEGVCWLSAEPQTLASFDNPLSKASGVHYAC
jgi:hypothetical protein